MLLAYKNLKDIFRNGEQSISHAIRAQGAYWSIDEGLLQEGRSKKIQIVGIAVRETGDLYLTYTDFFYGDRLARLSHPWVRANERYLSLQHFRVSHGAIKFR